MPKIFYNKTVEKFLIPEIYSNENNATLNKAYAISNEALDQIFSQMHLTNKKALLVGSSGDQAINAILMGCKDITIIDGNDFARPFIEYKLAAIRYFDFDEFNKLFIKSQFFDWTIYAKISHLLSKNAKAFWDSLMLEQSSKENEGISAKDIKDKMLIVDHRDRFSDFYFDKNQYCTLKSLLAQKALKIRFKTAELKQFPKVLKQSYDLIYLSNIYDYYANINQKAQFEKIIKKLYANNLNLNGKIYVNYNFCTEKDDIPEAIAGQSIEGHEVVRYYEGSYYIDTAWIITKNEKNKEKQEHQK